MFLESIASIVLASSLSYNASCEFQSISLNKDTLVQIRSETPRTIIFLIDQPWEVIKVGAIVQEIPMLPGRFVFNLDRYNDLHFNLQDENQGEATAQFMEQGCQKK